MIGIGVEIGGTKLQAAVVRAPSEILLRIAAPSDPAAGAAGLRDVLAARLAELLAAWERDSRYEPPRGAGVGFGGPVDRERGIVTASFHVNGWNGFPLGAWLAERLGGMPVMLENDTNAAALAEAMVGAGRDARRVFYTNSGSGIGGGFVVGGALYHGRGPGEMELGHLRLGPEGGILEDVASGWAIDRVARAEAAAHPTGGVAWCARGASPSARDVAAAAAAGDAAACGILDAAARHYALALSHMTHLLNPDVVVLGGGVAEMGAAWRDRVAGFLRGFLMEPMQPGPDVRLAALGRDVVPVGAALVALRETG